MEKKGTEALILYVANLGETVLRAQAAPVSEEELARPDFQVFLDSLLVSMRFHDGVGLAAPQVFVSQRVIAVEVPPEGDDADAGLPGMVFVNPEITPIGKEQESDWEGCLSLKDLRGLVSRWRSVRLKALDRLGQPVELTLHGFAARVVQHEVDHLDGVVFVDRMANMSSLCFSRELARQGSAEDHEPTGEENLLPAK